jgi:hypothetical protein
MGQGSQVLGRQARLIGVRSGNSMSFQSANCEGCAPPDCNSADPLTPARLVHSINVVSTDETYANRGTIDGPPLGGAGGIASVSLGASTAFALAADQRHHLPDLCPPADSQSRTASVSARSGRLLACPHIQFTKHHGSRRRKIASCRSVQTSRDKPILLRDYSGISRHGELAQALA